MKFSVLFAAFFAFCLLVSSAFGDGNPILATWNVGGKTNTLTLETVSNAMSAQELISLPGETNAWETVLGGRWIIGSLNVAERLNPELTNNPENRDAILSNRAYLTQILLFNKGKELYLDSEKTRPFEIARASHILVNLKGDPDVNGSNSLRTNTNEIVAEKEKFASDILETLLDSKFLDHDFSNSAVVASDDTGSGMRGGDLGYFCRGLMVPEFEKAVFDTREKGLVTNLVKTRYGYHIIYVTEPAVSADWENQEARIGKAGMQRIERQVKQQILNEARNTAITNLFEFDSARNLLIVHGTEYGATNIGLIPLSAELVKVNRTVYTWKEIRDVILVFDPAFTNSMNLNLWLKQVNNFRNFYFFAQFALDADYKDSPEFAKKIAEGEDKIIRELVGFELAREFFLEAKKQVTESAIENQYNIDKLAYTNLGGKSGEPAKEYPSLTEMKPSIRSALLNAAKTKLADEWQQKLYDKYALQWNEEGLKAFGELIRTAKEEAGHNPGSAIKKQMETNRTVEKKDSK
jgi:hypothetical protein